MPPFTPINKLVNKIAGMEVGASTAVNRDGGTAAAVDENNGIHSLIINNNNNTVVGTQSDDPMLIDTSSSPSRSSPDLTSERFITAGADEDDDGEGEDLAAPASEDDEASSSFYDIDTPTPSPAPVVMKCSSEEPHTTTPTIHIDDLSAVERLLLLLCQENVPFGEISIVLAYRTGVYMSPNALRSRCAVLLVRLGWITAEGVDSEDTMPSDHVDDDGTNDASPPEGKGRTQHLQDEGDGNVYGIGPEDSGNDADVESNGDFLEMDID